MLYCKYYEFVSKLQISASLIFFSTLHCFKKNGLRLMTCISENFNFIIWIFKIILIVLRAEHAIRDHLARRACLTGRERRSTEKQCFTQQVRVQPRSEPRQASQCWILTSGLDFILPFWKEEVCSAFCSPTLPNTAFISYFNLESVWNPQKLLWSLSLLLCKTRCFSLSLQNCGKVWVRGPLGKCLANDELSRNTCCWKYCGP